MSSNITWRAGYQKFGEVQPGFVRQMVVALWDREVSLVENCSGF